MGLVRNENESNRNGSILRYVLHTNDRSVGHRPNGGDAEGRGGAFPTAEGWLYGFINTRQCKSQYLIKVLYRHFDRWDLCLMTL